MMKKLIAVTAIAASLSGCDNVPSGYVGVKVDRYGSDRGVQVEPIQPGRYYTGFNTDVFVFPTFIQNDSWTKAITNESPSDESFTFQTVEGLSVNADIGFSYLIPANKVTLVFQKYRRGVEEISSVVLRNLVRDALNNVASTMVVEDVYGKGKIGLQQKVFELVKTQAEVNGIQVDKIYFIGEMRLPASVKTSIDTKIKATQIAIQKENELRAAEADAAKAVAQARGQAEANELIAESLRANPAVLQMKAIEAWDGKLPMYVGSGPIPFINVK